MKQAKLSPLGKYITTVTTWNQRDSNHEENRVNKFCISLEPNTNTTQPGAEPAVGQGGLEPPLPPPEPLHGFLVQDASSRGGWR